MTQPWAVIIAAISAALVAGAFALLGHRIGLRNGRLQATDQATVEHEQWLRGQRQTAYLDLLTSWDKLISSFTDIERERSEARTAGRLQPDIPGSAPIIDYVVTLTESVQPHLERVLLLGPDQCERVAEDMQLAVESVRNVLVGYLPGMDPAQHRLVQQTEDPWGNLVQARARAAAPTHATARPPARTHRALGRARTCQTWAESTADCDRRRRLAAVNVSQRSIAGWILGAWLTPFVLR
ncbi:hypothetical protein ACWCPS_36080 [Streptomyces mauvecolor]